MVSTNSLASFAVGRPVHGAFTYSVPEALAARLLPGQRVLVPFGRTTALAFYLGPASSPPRVGKLRQVERELEAEPALPADVMALLRFASEHYRYPLGETIRMALPPGLADPIERRIDEPDREQFAQAMPGAESAALERAPAQAAALAYLLAVGGRAALAEIAHAIPGSRESLRRLAQRGLVRIEDETVEPVDRGGWGQPRPAQLTAEQQVAVERIIEARRIGGFRAFLLHGVTGSGKTEVYLRCAEAALSGGRGALVLVPEIALTPQLVGRFRSRFGPEVAVLHSGLKERERLRQWHALRSGKARIAVGVRSAIFAPVRDLSLIVVDEEHDPSFKQEEKLRYNARDLALVRASQLGATAVLGSATPSLETLQNARRGKYELLELRSRVDDRPLPQVSVVDLRLERPRSLLTPSEEPPMLSAPVISAIDEVLGRGHQVIIFLNRRGHSTFLVCEICGASLRCDSCDVCLTHHLSSSRVLCHYCGFAARVPQTCRECGGVLLRLGAGTERVEAEVASRFRGARVARLDRDSATSPERLTAMLAAFARRELDVLVGTQMIAKGHDFPGVTLVCVILADTSLAIPDFRAAERTFHLLTQVGGRAGRGGDPGRVMVQTYNPNSEPVRRLLSHDFHGFAKAELERRRALAYPPFSRLVAIRIEGENAQRTADSAQELGARIAARLPHSSRGVRLLGPAPAPVTRIRNKTRWQILLKGPTYRALAGPMAAVEAYAQVLSASVKVAIDVDPGALL
jgi:primosomal protein N' (replication factor Y)